MMDFSFPQIGYVSFSEGIHIHLGWVLVLFVSLKDTSNIHPLLLTHQVILNLSNPNPTINTCKLMSGDQTYPGGKQWHGSSEGDDVYETVGSYGGGLTWFFCPHTQNWRAKIISSSISPLFRSFQIKFREVCQGCDKIWVVGSRWWDRRWSQMSKWTNWFAGSTIC